MRISLNWIKEYVDLEGIDINWLTNRFTLSTAEIEEVIWLGADINNVVVGKVLSVMKHPSSDKLSIVEVDVGDGIVTSVCGAPNVCGGILIPFVKIGGSNKKIHKVEKTSVLGIESNGVCCSAAELGISDEHSGLLILSGDYTPGIDIKKVLNIDDVIIEIDNKSLTHRPDLWGHYGIAREIAAVVGRKLKDMELYDVESEAKKSSTSLPKLKIKIEDTRKCFRYSGLGIDNVSAKKADINMQIRLYYCGMRSISLLVDLTNYIMLEMGQPMHAFDKNIVDNIIVKSLDKPTSFVTLDGTERELSADTLMICNDKCELAIAGIMGGKNSEVSDNTTSILLESANFEGPSIRKGGVKIGLRTEAVARFEKVLDPEMTVVAIKRFVKLLKDIDSGIVISSQLTDEYAKKFDPVKVIVEKSFIDKYIGQSIDDEVILNTLKSLEFCVLKDEDKFIIDVPSFRATKDITMKADIVEEIARIYGYDNISIKSAEIVLEPLIYNEDRIIHHKVKEILAENHGFSEVQSYIWYDNAANIRLGIGKRDGLKIINSCADYNDTLRDSLSPSMLYFAEENKKNFDEFGIFEIGSIFKIGEDRSKNCEEVKNLSLLLASKSVSEDELFYKAKGIITSLFGVIKNVCPNYLSDGIQSYPWVHATKSAGIKCGSSNDMMGYISVLHPMIKGNIDKKLNVVLVEINMNKFCALEINKVLFSDPSKYPEVSLDLSVLVDKEVLYENLFGGFKKFNNKLMLDCKFVGIYTGKSIPEDKKSLTFNFRIGSRDRTLSSEEIEDFRLELINYAKGMGCDLR